MKSQTDPTNTHTHTAHWPSPAEEGEPLKEEAPSVLHALSVGAPVHQAVVAEAAQHVQTLTGWDVPVTLLFDLRKDPRLDQRSPEKHTMSKHWVKNNGSCQQIHVCWNMLYKCCQNLTLTHAHTVCMLKQISSKWELKPRLSTNWNGGGCQWKLSNHLLKHKLLVYKLKGRHFLNAQDETNRAFITQIETHRSNQTTGWKTNKMTCENWHKHKVTLYKVVPWLPWMEDNN